MNNVELVNMNNVLASMFYRFSTILLKQERTVLFIHPLNGQPHLILNFIFCRIMTMREMLKSNLKSNLRILKKKIKVNSNVVFSDDGKVGDFVFISRYMK